MRRIAALVILAVTLTALASCGSKSNETASNPPPESTTPAVSTPNPAVTPAPTTDTSGAASAMNATPAAKSKYDDGPRASATPVNAALAAEGKTLFTSKGCATCHAFGKKVIGPDLKGVAGQRTAAWMEQQILHPEVMVKEDPISHGLLQQYKVPMTNQGLTPAQAKAVVEYIKQNP